MYLGVFSGSQWQCVCTGQAVGLSTCCVLTPGLAELWGLFATLLLLKWAVVRPGLTCALTIFTHFTDKEVGLE